MTGSYPVLGNDVCAAPVMMKAVERALFELEVPVTNVHMEHFDLA